MSTHWNHHALCSIDIETTGLDAAKHEIIPIAVLPLKPDLTPRTDVIPFYVEIAPQNDRSTFEPGAFRVNKLDIDHLIDTGLDPYRVADRFDEWFQGLGLPFKKKILPLAHNWPFEASFLTRSLGWMSFDDFFFGYRDTMTVANLLNDIADMNNEPWPFPKVSLTYLCSQLKVENENPHDALGDAKATAECYRRLVTRYKIY